MVKNDFSLTRRMLDLMLDKDKYIKKAKNRKIIGCVGIAVELAILSFLLVKLVPIMLINGLMLTFGFIALGLYGVDCLGIDKFIFSNFIKPALNDVLEIKNKEQDFIKMVKKRGITLDDKSFKLYRVSSYELFPNCGLQVKGTNKANKKIIDFNRDVNGNSCEVNEFIAASDKNNGVFGYFKVISKYEYVKGSSKDKGQPDVYWDWLDYERISEVPQEIQSKANKMYKDQYSPKIRSRRPNSEVIPTVPAVYR